MKSLYLKDFKRRYLYSNIEHKKIIYKFIYNNLNLKKKLRTKIYNKLILLSLESSITRVHNRCVLTNRPRAVYQKFKFSRLIFRKLALQGEIPGIIKATW